MKNKNMQFASNTFFTAVNLIVQLSISFFLTSYLVNTVGETEYGFFTMANNIVNYALIVTNALNSLAARFIGVGIHGGDEERAKKVFSSVFAGDLVFTTFILAPSSWAIFHIESFINIPPDLVKEVRLLFVFVFLNMCLNVVFAVFGSVYTIYNRLDIAGALQAVSNVIKAVLLICLYITFDASIIYLGLATFIATAVVVLGNVFFTYKYMPKNILSLSQVNGLTIKEIMFSGIWNSINQLSVTLLSGLSLLIANLAVSAKAMGYLSLANTLPGVISMCISALSNLFTPIYLKLFAVSDFDGLYQEVKKSVKFMTIISAIPIGFLISFGINFFELWTPNTNIQIVHTLSILVILPSFTGGAISSMNYLYTVANRVKFQALVLLFTGVVNVIVVFILLNTTELGVYAIAGVSAILGFIRNFLFNAPYAAICINKPYYSFWPDMAKSVISLIIVSLLGFVICSISNPSNWIALISCAFIYAVMSLIVLLLLLFNKNELLSFIKNAKRVFLKE